MTPTTLAIVVPDLAVGGLQEMAVRLALALDRDAYAPRFYTFDGGGPLAPRLAGHDLPHADLPRGTGVQPGYAKRLATRLAADGVDLVHCHNVTALFHGGRAAWRAGKLPVLYTEHDRSIPGPLRHRLLHRWLARRTAATVAVSQGLADALVRWEGFPAERMHQIVNGVPDPRETFGGDRAAARAELGWDGRKTVLAVGSLTEVKDHAALLAAFAPLAPAARLAIAGGGPLRGALDARARDLGLDPDEVLLGERDDVPRLLAACDLFCLPSRSEGLPLSLVEAHGAGRPSVATDVGGNGEVLVADRTGLLVPPGSIDALTGALRRLLDDGERAARLGAAARARYEREFTHARMVERYVALYESLVPTRAG